MWADRVVGSALADQVLASGWATGDELAGIAAGWRRWAADPDAVFVVPHTEILCRAG
jgi:hypothetical protein